MVTPVEVVPVVVVVVAEVDSVVVVVAEAEVALIEVVAEVVSVPAEGVMVMITKTIKMEMGFDQTVEEETSDLVVQTTVVATMMVDVLVVMMRQNAK